VNAVRLIGAGYSYPGITRRLFRNVSITLEKGDLTALYGSNGSGKTTLARLIAGLIEPTEGVVSRPDATGWNRIGLVMQEPSAQLVAATVEEEIAWGLENLRTPLSEMKSRVGAALERFGLSKLRNEPPERLSDGERQLTAIAAVTVMDPAFVIFDEAASFLDPYWRKRIWEIAGELRATAGVLWVTAKPEEARRCHRVWRMEGGTVASEALG